MLKVKCFICTDSSNEQSAFGGIQEIIIQLKIYSRFIGKNISGKYSQKLFDHAKQSATNTLKTASKKQLKKLQKQLVIRLVIKLLMKSQKSQKLHHKIIQKQLKVKQKIQDLIKKYQKKDISLQKKDSKLFMI